MSSVSYLLSSDITQKQNIDIFVKSITSNSANVDEVEIFNSNQVFTNNKNMINLVSFVNVDAESLLNNIFHHGEPLTYTLLLPSVVSIYNYLHNTYKIPFLPEGFTFTFKIVNKSTNIVSLSNGGDTTFFLNNCVNGSNTLVTINANTTREFTCRIDDIGRIVVFG
jgi:hypothetical protein